MFGPERAATAAAIASELWQASDRYVLINGFRPDGWAFGLAAGGLAADAGAPILIVGDEVPDATSDLAGSCGDTDLIAIGGSAVIAPAVIDALDAGC